MEDNNVETALLDQSLVLLIDDNESCCATAAVLVREAGREFLAVADTMAALSVLVERRPATIIVDQDTGPVEVWHFCQLLRQHPVYSKACIAVLNKRNDIVEQARAEASGADALLLKPFAAKELKAILDPQRSAA